MLTASSPVVFFDRSFSLFRSALSSFDPNVTVGSPKALLDVALTAKSMMLKYGNLGLESLARNMLESLSVSSLEDWISEMFSGFKLA